MRGRLSLLVLAGCGGEAVSPDAAVDAAVEVWATYTIERSRHDADLAGGGGHLGGAGADHRAHRRDPVRAMT